MAKNTKRKRAARKGAAKWIPIPAGVKAVRVRRVGGRLKVEGKR